MRTACDLSSRRDSAAQRAGQPPFAGLATGSAARVLDHALQPIPGLYAVGNDMHSVMGGHYPSGGVTLAPGMTLGYLASRALSSL